jgi:hypothetical protein
VRVTKESETKPGFCQCGRPLHYSDQSIKNMVDKIIASADGPFVDIHVIGGPTYRVQRHFIALHGFSPELAEERGFEQVKGKPNDTTGRGRSGLDGKGQAKEEEN